MTVDKYYKGYYMITSKCNLSCSYCVLENAPHQLKQELNVQQKVELISHLYHKLRFRCITISGGEALIIGKKAPSDFNILINHLQQFKSKNAEDNLRIHLYTNGLIVTEELAEGMKGVIDEVSITIDSSDKDTLQLIGRNRNRREDYFSKAVAVCLLLSKKGIRIKLHTVISSLNVETLAGEVKIIYDSLIKKEVKISNWKFYQYMSYDVAAIDKKHQVTREDFTKIQREITDNLKEYKVTLHFKSNKEMNESLFNILSYGNAQYMIPGDSWTSSKRTESLFQYSSMADMFEKNRISKELFDRYHCFNPNAA